MKTPEVTVPEEIAVPPSARPARRRAREAAGRPAPLPPKFVEEWRERARGCRLFGRPVEELSREELLAAIAWSFDRARKAEEERLREVEAGLAKSIFGLRRKS